MISLFFIIEKTDIEPKFRREYAAAEFVGGNLLIKLAQRKNMMKKKTLNFCRWEQRRGTIRNEESKPSIS